MISLKFQDWLFVLLDQIVTMKSLPGCLTLSGAEFWAHLSKVKVYWRKIFGGRRSRHKTSVAHLGVMLILQLSWLEEIWLNLFGSLLPATFQRRLSAWGARRSTDGVRSRSLQIGLRKSCLLKPDALCRCLIVPRSTICETALALSRLRLLIMAHWLA